MRKHLLFFLAILATAGLIKAQTPVTNFSEGFEDGTLGIMTTINADGDNYDWKNSSTLQAQGDGHDGSVHYAYSESWAPTGRWGLNPDNYLVSPQIAVNSTSVFTFFVCSDWYAYVGEHYGVAVSTASNDDPGDFVTIAEWTLTDKGTRDDDQGPWHEHNIDLSQYAGQLVYVAIRHFYCTNIYRIDVDDISVTTETAGCEAPVNFVGQLNDATITLRWDTTNAASYKVYRSTNGVSYQMIANVNDIFYEDNVTENNTYYYRVTAVYADGSESTPATTAEGEYFLMFEVGDLNIAEDNLGVSLYPNPSNGVFNITCQGMTKVTVYGLRGEIIMDVNTNADSYTISDLGTGVYFVRIETTAGCLTQKIVRL